MLRLRTLAWLCCLLPFAAAHGAYLIAASEGLVPWCLPYVDGCTSISRAARHGFANDFFQAIMLPCALLLAPFWWQASNWLRELGNPARRRRRAMLALGVAGAFFLAVYVGFLGAEGAPQQLLRRYGVTFYFAFTVVAQMLCTSALVAEPRVAPRLRGAMLAFCAALLLLGLASIPLQHLVADADAALDAVEWNYALLMTLFFPLLGAASTRRQD